MQTIRWGIIGAGRISSAFAKALNQIENVEITAIGSKDLTRAKKFADKFNIKKAYKSYEELVQDEEIDVVYIGTPHTEHKKNSILCLNNKKSVLCEKPFTVNADETKELIDLAKSKNLFLMEAMWTKFLPTNKKVTEWIESGIIGKITTINASFGFYNETNEENRLFNKNLAGGALLDVGIYPVTYATQIMKQLPSTILSSSIIGNTGVDEQNSIIFKYDNDVIANLASAISSNLGSDAIIIGTKGKIQINAFFRAESASLYIGEELIETFTSPFEINGYEYEALEVCNCIRSGLTESKINPLKDTLEIMTILDTIRKQWNLKYPCEENS